MGRKQFGWLGAGILSLGAMAPFASVANTSTDQLIVRFNQQPSITGQVAEPNKIVLNWQKNYAQTLAVQNSNAQNGTPQDNAANFKVLRKMGNGAHVVKLDKPYNQSAMAELLALLEQEGTIDYVEPDHRVEPAVDPFYGFQWYLDENFVGIHADSAWPFSTGEGVVIGVLDTGALPHQDLVDNLIPGYDFIIDVFTANDGDGRDSDASDPGDGVMAGECGNGSPSSDKLSTWHGSHVAGIIAAEADNGIGIHGIAHDAQIQPLRVLGRCGGYTSDIADAIYWGAGYTIAGIPDNPTPAQVLNLSLSTSAPTACSQTYIDAISAAVGAGVMVVAAAGNNAADADDYAPGNCPGVFTVAATNRFGFQADYTNVGSVVDVAAPGGTVSQLQDLYGIWSTVSSGDFAPGTDIYEPKQGTSMATPMVSATAALMLSVEPQATLEELYSAIVDTAQDFPSGCAGCGTGLLHSEEAVKRIMGLTSEDAVADLLVVLAGDNGKFVEDPENPDEGTIQYQVRVTNQGPDDAMDIDVGLILPNAVELDLLTSDIFMICNIDSLVCSVDSLNSGQTATFTVLVRTAETGKMDFAASAYGADADPNLDNNYATGRFGGALLLELLLLSIGLVMARSSRAGFVKPH